MTLSAYPTPHPPLAMPAKTLKFGPYRHQAEAVARRRKELKLSQAAVAETYGGQQGYISDIERGWVNFSGADAEWYERMSRALQWTPLELMRAVGVKIVIADESKNKDHNSHGLLPVESDIPIYATVVIPIMDSGRAGGNLQERTVFVDKEIAALSGLGGLYLKESFISAAAVGMLAIYADLPAEVDDIVVIEHQQECHVAYAMGGGMVATDRPINARTPAEFRPDRILGVVQRLQHPDRPRRPRLLS